MSEQTQTKENMASSDFSILKGTLNRSQWLLQINTLVDENALDPSSLSPISIFQLPDSVHNDNPSSYLPRLVAFSPYHHFRQELQKMDLFKLEKATNLITNLQFHQLVDQMKPLELKIRTCFDPSLEMDGETLSWVMLINGLFLFELLQKNSFSRRPMKFPSQIFYGKLFSEFEIVSDMLMLENQFPFFVFKEILPKNCFEKLTLLLYQFCESVSPFELLPCDPERNSSDFHPNLTEIYQMSHHLLHFLYLLVLIIPDERMFVAYSLRINMDNDTSVNFLTESLSILGSFVDITFIQQFKETFGLILRLFRLLGYVIKVTKPNLVEKQLPIIPSAADLVKAGVRFKSTKNGVLKCRFDQETLTLTLPCIHLDGFSQVLLKNFVAYEAMAELTPPCFVQYVALMNGLLTNSKDVKILEKAEIIYNHQDSDEEVVKLFNGVKNSTSSLKKTSILEIHIQNGSYMGSGSEFIEEIMSNYENGLKGMAEEINKCYESCWRVKMKRYVSNVLKIMVILVIIFLIVVVILRSICSSISCPGKIFKLSIANDVTSLHLFDFM